MTMPNFTESTIAQNATSRSYSRGEDYAYSGAVDALVLRGNSLEAEVQGSQYEPYRVQLTFDEVGITDAYCSCPYDWGGWCKHIVAVLLAYLDDPETVEERPELSTQIQELDAEQLEELLLALARDPEVAPAIERHLKLMRAATDEASSERRTVINPEPFRQRAYGIIESLDHIRPSQAYWHISQLLQNLEQLANEAQSFIENGDGRNALLILEAITDVYVNRWMMLDGSSGETGEFFYPLGKRWIEALLSADLTATEQETWANKLEQWQSEISDYGVDEAFVAGAEAAREGWDDLTLQKLLQSDRETEEEEEQTFYYTHEIALTRLKVLERQERYDEYLRLAKVMPQKGHYLAMLVRLGRIEEAVEQALQQMRTPGEALALAHALRDHKELAAALRIAEHGLTLNNAGSNPHLSKGSYDSTFSGSKAMLASWLCDLALGMGEHERALIAADITFRESPSLNAYLKVKELAKDEWEERRAALINYLHQHAAYILQAKIEVFLHEGLIDDAINTIKGHHSSYSLLEQVVSAAVQTRPNWVIQVTQKQAEEIMDAGKSKYYDHAVKWLKHTHAAYHAANRTEEWKSYLLGLRQTHRRKYKLIGLLNVF